MGVYFFYANRTKQEWFFVDPIGLDIRAGGVGRGIGSRCFSLLLLDHQPRFTTLDDHARIGSWIGDDVFVSGDDYFPDFKATVVEQWTDIASEVIEMLSEVDPHGYIENGEQWLVEYASSANMPEPVRRNLLKEFRGAREFNRNRAGLVTDRYDRIIAALRPPSG